MVRVTGNGCVLDGGEGRKTPPLPYIEVSDLEARALIGLGMAKLVGEALAAEPEPLPEPVIVPVVEPVAVVPPVVEPVIAPPNADGAGDPDRAQTIADALDLLEPEHLVKTGPRKGKPSLKAMEEITGIDDLTVAEIDAAAAAREVA